MLTKISAKRRSKWNVAIMLAAMLCLIFTELPPVIASTDCPVIDDVPIGLQIKGTPPLIMFTIDDSGSMSYSLTLENTDFNGYNHWHKGGEFKKDGGDRAYVFDDPGDHTYNRDFDGVEHLYWYTQFYHTNKMYYDPNVTYAPWPRWNEAGIVGDAPDWIDDPNPATDAFDMDPDNPRSNPMKDDYTTDLDDIYYSTAQDKGIIIDNSKDHSTLFNIHHGIVIDNKDGEPDFSVSGEWTESSAKDEYPDPTHGGHSDYGNDEGDWAEWTHTFTADEAGIDGTEYYVEVWFCYWDTRDDEAQYTITYDPADGSADTVDIINDVTQRDEDTAGSWQNLYELGDWAGGVKTFTVAEGDTITVRVTRVDDDDDGSTSADAVRFLDVDTPAVYEETGTWEESGSEPEWNNDSHYSNEVGATAVWRHQFTADDLADGSEFLVQGWWNCFDGRNRNAKFIINDGTLDHPVFPVDQREGSGQCGQWVTLGEDTDTYTFSEGDWGAVTLEHYNALGHDDDESSVADAVRFISPAEWAENVDIKNAHYYIHKGYDKQDNDGDGDVDEAGESDEIYLVNMVGPSDSGDIDIYRVTEDAEGKVIALEEKTAAEAGLADITSRRTYEMERVNFANWFSFHRRRLLTAKNAIGNVVVDMQNVFIGYRTIHERITQQVLPVDHGHEGEIWNERAYLLQLLYSNSFRAGDGTPLREALNDTGRYFKGELQPGTIYNDYTTSDYYPFFKPEDGGECQQSYCILMTDGFWNGDSPGVGNEDGNNDSDHDGGEFADGYENTLADVAMLYYETDLNANLANEVKSTKTIDTANHQRMVTYGLSFGAKGTLDPDLTPDCSATPGSCPDWPDPTDTEDDERIDDLYHAAVNGRGLYLNAGSPDELLEAMRALKEDIESRRVRTEGSAAVNSQELIAGSQLYIGGYNSFGWAGVVTAWDISESDGSLSEAWNAATQLEARINDDGKGHADRLIATYDGTAGVAFDGDLTGLHDSLETDVVNYLRGDKTNEQRVDGSFRNRLTAWDPDSDETESFTLGDIVHSSPTYNDGVLYVGANDGMLHAFDTATGEELFAYVPKLIHQNLQTLTDAESRHHYFVDLTPTVRNIGGATSLLVGGLGKGGKGYFALNVAGAKTIVDVSDVEAMVLWEFDATSGTATPDSPTGATLSDDMGYSFSKPVISRTHSTTHPYVVIFGNGYGSSSGTASLFIVDPSNGAILRYLNTDDTGTDTCNGMSSPFPADLRPADGKMDYIYVGDLDGNMWKIDMTDSDHTNWDFAFFDGTTPQPLFTARDGESPVNPQPITGRPDVTFHCSEKEIGHMVIFGTGQLLGTPDVGNTNQQTLYGIWDYGEEGATDEYVGTFNRPDHLSKWLTSDTITILEQEVAWQDVEDGNTLRVFTDNEPNWAATDDVIPPNEVENPAPNADPPAHAAWYLDLPDDKERITQNVTIRTGKAIVTSNIPGSSGDICSAGGAGNSYIQAVDPCTGGNLNLNVFDTNEDGVIDDDDMIEMLSDPDNPDSTLIKVPASGIRRGGLLSTPVVVSSGETEYLYSPTDPLNPEGPLMSTGAELGMTFWIQHLE